MMRGHRRCEICGIREYHQPNTSISRIRFSTFPLEVDRCREWLKAVGNEDLVHLPIEKLHTNRTVCSNHFSRKHFNKKGNRLKGYAVPTLNLRAPPLSDSQLAEFPQHMASYRRSEGTDTPGDHVSRDKFEQTCKTLAKSEETSEESTNYVRICERSPIHEETISVDLGIGFFDNESAETNQSPSRKHDNEDNIIENSNFTKIVQYEKWPESGTEKGIHNLSEFITFHSADNDRKLDNEETGVESTQEIENATDTEVNLREDVQKSADLELKAQYNTSPTLYKPNKGNKLIKSKFSRERKKDTEKLSKVRKKIIENKISKSRNMATPFKENNSKKGESLELEILLKKERHKVANMEVEFRKEMDKINELEFLLKTEKDKVTDMTISLRAEQLKVIDMEHKLKELESKVKSLTETNNSLREEMKKTKEIKKNEKKKTYVVKEIYLF